MAAYLSVGKTLMQEGLRATYVLIVVLPGPANVKRA